MARREVRQVWQTCVDVRVVLNASPAEEEEGEEGEGGAPTPSKADVDLWNAVLEMQTRAFAAENPGVWARTFDANAVLNAVLDVAGVAG